jgi:hypothetical protein
MRSKVVDRILENTPYWIKDKVDGYAKLLLSLGFELKKHSNNKTAYRSIAILTAHHNNDTVNDGRE